MIRPEIIGLSMERTPLRQVIKRMPNPTRENVKKLYGDIGVDIFEGKDKITILSDNDYKKSRSLIGRMIEWWAGSSKFDYEEKDSIKDLVLKYGCNNVQGSYDEIEQKFGQEGIRVANIYKKIGYFI